MYSIKGLINIKVIYVMNNVCRTIGIVNSN